MPRALQKYGLWPCRSELGVAFQAGTKQHQQRCGIVGFAPILGFELVHCSGITGAKGGIVRDALARAPRSLAIRFSGASGKREQDQQPASVARECSQEIRRRTDPPASETARVKAGSDIKGTTVAESADSRDTRAFSPPMITTPPFVPWPVKVRA
jgi:hypothetical protein